MSIIYIPASRSGKSIRRLSCPQKSGRQQQGQLWSNLKVICDLLKVSYSPRENDGTLFQHVQFKAGQRVHATGNRFDTFHIVNSGFIKTVVVDELGTDQVLGFPMKGDILGLDAIDTGHYVSEAIALSDCDLILMPFKKLGGLARTHVELESFLFEVISRELSREREVISMLGGLGAEAKVARFLLSLSNRFAVMGYSDKVFNLRMTRQEIGSYLGITLETVSRTLTAFKRLDLITVNRRTIGIRNAAVLKELRRLAPSRMRVRPIGNARPQGALIQRSAAHPFMVAHD